MTVTGPVAPEALGVTDAHNHVWIFPAVSTPGLPVLADAESIAQEMAAYRDAGGCAMVDCQPGRAGRDAVMLKRLSEQSQVAVVACTGFHLRKYYPPDEPLWSWSADAAAALFIRELRVSVEETSVEPADHLRSAIRNPQSAVIAGFIKVACEATLAASPQHLLQAAAQAAVETGVALEVHTEKGAAAESIVQFFGDQGVHLRQLVICHIDKRPDFGLHRELAVAGVLLEYDTFYRPKYDPERGVWPLLEQMIGANFGSSVALATDIAERDLWETMGGGPGLAGLLTIIRPRLLKMGVSPGVLAGLLGGNIVRRLASHQPEG
jgi:phosphotriesterase-related protein